MILISVAKNIFSAINKHNCKIMIITVVNLFLLALQSCSSIGHQNMLEVEKFAKSNLMLNEKIDFINRIFHSPDSIESIISSSLYYHPELSKWSVKNTYANSLSKQIIAFASKKDYKKYFDCQFISGPDENHWNYYHLVQFSIINSEYSNVLFFFILKEKQWYLISYEVEKKGCELTYEKILK